MFLGEDRIKKVYLGGDRIKSVYLGGERLWQAETVLAALSCAAGGGPGVTSGTAWYYAGTWDLSGVAALSATVACDVRVGYWQSPRGDVYSCSTATYLQLADGTRLALGVGAISLDLSSYTDEQKASVQLCGEVSWSISSVTNSAFYGAWSITNAVATY